MFTTNSDLLVASGLTTDEINVLLAGTGLAGLGEAFAACEKTYGINAYFIIAHAAIESAWGNSWFAVNRNNLFGLDAYDADPMNASAYATKQACIDYYGHFLKTYYLTPGAVYYNGATPHGVFVDYSSSHDTEASSVVGVMNQLQAKETPQASALPPTSALQLGTINSRTYKVQGGDSMSLIATIYGMPLTRLEQLNPKAGHPAGNFGNIWPGDVLTVSGASPPAVPANEPVYISVPAGYNGYLSVIAAKYGTTVNQLVSWNESKYPAISANDVDAGWLIRVR